MRPCAAQTARSRDNPTPACSSGDAAMTCPWAAGSSSATARVGPARGLVFVELSETLGLTNCRGKLRLLSLGRARTARTRHKTLSMPRQCQGGTAFHTDFTVQKETRTAEDSMDVVARCVLDGRGWRLGGVACGSGGVSVWAGELVVRCGCGVKIGK